jgi:small nuclear ribonucleoprotein (snRNP)-like protein
MQNNLNVLHTWSNTWQLNVSTSKRATMRIHAVDKCFNLHLNNVTITKTNEFKDLGVIIDENLEFTSHINHAVAKAIVRAC